MNEKDLLNLLGLEDKKITLTLEDDILNIMDNYVKENEIHEKKKQEFMQLFRECFQEIVNTFRDDPKEQIAVNCAGCRYANKIDLNYSKPKTIRTNTNGMRK